MYSIREVAKLLKLSYPTTYKMVMDGRIKAVKMGFSWRISQDEIDRILKEGIRQ
jgi:excisionase family DNA binding protein